MPIDVKAHLDPIPEDIGKEPYKEFGDDVCRMEQGARKGGSGRKPTKFDYSFVKVAANLVAAGFTYEDIGFVLGVGKATIDNWRVYYPQFGAALAAGKKVAVQHLVAQGLKSAIGYDHDLEFKYYDAKGNLKRRTVQTKHEPVNDRLLIFMLCNLDRNWKSVHKVEVEGRSFVMNLTGKLEKDAIAAFAGKLGERYGSKQLEGEVKVNEEAV